MIERRRDADGVREKSRDRDEEQDVTRTVTVRSHHEVVRVDAHPSATRVCRQSNVDHSLYLLRQKPAKGFRPNPDDPTPPTSAHAPGKYHLRNVPERANLNHPANY